MNLELSIRISDFLDKLKIDDTIYEYIKQKRKVLENKELLKKIEKIHNLDIYSEEYRCIKHELFQNSDYKKYLELENKIFYLILEINQELKSLTGKRGCSNENH